MEIFKALRASLFNFQSSIFNSEVYFAQGMGEAIKKPALLTENRPLKPNLFVIWRIMYLRLYYIFLYLIGISKVEPIY